MSERRQWSAKDAEAIQAMFPDEPINNQDAQDAVALARHFGYEVREGMPEGDDYWALEPRCVLRPWYRRVGDESWSCLGCIGSYAFDSQIREAFMQTFRAGQPLK